VTRPNLYCLPPGADFAAAFADGFYARYAGLEPAELARATILSF